MFGDMSTSTSTRPLLNTMKRYYTAVSCYIDIIVIDYYNDCFFGLARMDFSLLLNTRKMIWSAPEKERKKRNAEHMMEIKEGQMMYINL
jgi:hypothetical protein